MLDRLFSPRGIAVIGASRTPKKLGHDVLQNVKQFGFKGKIYPVNPKARSILRLPSYKSVLDIKGRVDVAVIMVPAPFVASVLKECGQKGVSFAVIITAGFKEVGGEGVAAEQEITAIAKQYHIRIIGPNCLGFINTKNKLNASFATGMPDRGNIAMLSQSGAMGVAMLDWAYQADVGFSKVISIGNKADISELELLEYFGQDPDTDVIMMYLESINEGRAFITAAAKVSKKKPIIVLKAGKSDRAKKAVSSHTGSLAGSNEAVSAAFERAGIIQAGSVEEFFDIGLCSALSPLPRNENFVIITNAGGPGIMAVDAVADSHISLKKMSRGEESRLATGLPASASTKNPIDIIGDAPPERYAHALKVALRSRDTAGAIVILTPQVMTDEDATAHLVIEAARKSKKTVITSFMGGLDVNSGRHILQKGGIPNYDTPERAVRALSAVINYAQQRQKARGLTTRRATTVLPDHEGHFQIRTTEAEKILTQYDLPVTRSRLVTTKKDLSKIKRYPVVLKAASRTVVHKAASGAVKLGIENVTQARKAYSQLQSSLSKKHEFEGVLAQKQLDLTDAREVIIGMKRDPSFGPLMLFGLGGSLVEIYHDISFGLAPLSLRDAKRMIRSIKAAPLLEGYNTQDLAKTLVAVSKLAQDYPEITELDINPMVLLPNGKNTIIDVRMMTT
jgi:acetyltransferase